MKQLKDCYHRNSTHTVNVTHGSFKFLQSIVPVTLQFVSASLDRDKFREDLI